MHGFLSGLIIGILCWVTNKKILVVGEFWVTEKRKKVDFLVVLKCYFFLGGFKSESDLVGSNNNIRKIFSLVSRRASGD